MHITFLPRDIIRQRLATIGMEEDGIKSTMAYIDRLTDTIEVKPDMLSFVDTNGAMLHPVCFDLSTIRM